MTRVLAIRLDNEGDVLLAGPAIRALAAPAERVTLLCGPGGRHAARLLPGVDDVLVWRAPWIDPEPERVDGAHVNALIEAVRRLEIDQAVIFGSFHQSPLPTALLLRLADVPFVAATSVDYAGSLLDVRHQISDDVHEVQRSLDLVRELGYELPADDDGALRVRLHEAGPPLDRPYVVVHPGASVPARAWAPERNRELVAALAQRGRRVVVTGGLRRRRRRPGPRRWDLLQRARRCAGRGGRHRRGKHGTGASRRGRPHARGLPLCADRAGGPLAAMARAARAAASRRPVCGLPRPAVPGGGPPVPGRGAPRGRARRRRAPGAGGGGGVKILLWHVHGAWTTAFVHGRHEYVVPVLPDRGPDGVGIARTYDWPDDIRELTPAQLRREHFDLVILQRPHELENLCEDWTGRRPGRDVPAVYVEHNAPQGLVNGMRHPAAGRDDLAIVHVTHFNDLFWDGGGTRSRVIEHGVVDPGERYTGELPHAAVVVNEARRRARVTGTDLLERFSEAGRIDLFGIDARSLGGTEDLPQGRLHDEMARRRVYLHPIRWTSLGLSLLEAMHLGMPVIALGTTEVREAVPEAAGVVSTNVRELTDAMRRLLADPDEAGERGRAARTAALERYSLERFLDDWDTALEEEVAA
jgi:hypothetical protein